MTLDPSQPLEGATDASLQLDLRVAHLAQLFNAMDPAPFRERDLDPNAVTYIVDWGRETPAGKPLELIVHLGAEQATADATSYLREAIQAYFANRAIVTRRQLRRLFRVGRISLVIGIVFLAAAMALGELVASIVSKEGYNSIIQESFIIGGWVALWRPIEIFLYEWWPIRAEARLYDRLGRAHVTLCNAQPSLSENGRRP
jgi:hypothetical protein